MKLYHIGHLIRDKRVSIGMTQKQLAEQIHVSDKAISKWERGHGQPKVCFLLSLSTILEIDAKELLAAYRPHDH